MPEPLSTPELAALLFRLALDLVVAFAIIRVVYQRLYKRQDYVFTYALLNLITFGLCFFMSRTPIQLGFALGLFGVFGILRYRTEAIRLRDLTYLFVLIGVGIINAVGVSDTAILPLVAINLFIVAAVMVLERPFASQRIEERTITYDRLDLLRPDQQAALFVDVETRTGLSVHRVVVDSLDLVKDVASITVHHKVSSK